MTNWNKWKISSINGMSDTIKARRFVTESYRCGLINWNTYNLALDRIQRVQNGDWMFDKHDNCIRKITVGKGDTVKEKR
jgi:hypothetical protein